ncbi:aldehyde dehydrogenase family protein [Streptomyces sp. DSM 44917]|uniref:aldehyde dehydrogenase (NAD(+)) n=1 Tax=Streptomyces boetiae TaxID=3075541 RepID=A0ABU2L5R8_9ACTN|nr:aldehyde dehydrogenase family protein [Streptomyces sp. DSM 44917]MDT0306903.1 aldehyde dehydrogenase family protein [Streptomyces sp. DSM 44917]
METHEGQYIGGAWRPSAGRDVIEDVNPATEQVIATVPAGTAEDVDAAVAAARGAATTWGRSDRRTRLDALTRLRDGLAARREDIVRTVVAELGTPVRTAEAVQAGLPVAVASTYLEILADYPFEEQVGNSRVFAEPAGVVAALTPWNYPLHQIVAKVVPALAAGCTVVLKPAEDTPLVARIFAEVVDAAGLPPGTVNVISGRGAEAGAALASHPGVDLVSFTGSTAVGRQVAAAAGSNLARVALELGGKSANVILPGADLARAVKTGVSNAFLNGGQTCSAWTRMLVSEADLEQAVDLARQAAERFTPGDPADPATRLGPMVSARQRDRVRGCIEAGVAAGARLVTGGPEAPEKPGTGFYVRPTVFADATPEMSIAREEIFGPVLTLLSYADEDEALALANATDYGLAGGVWAADQDRAVAFARRMATGQVDINGAAFNPRAPFGGFKNSGIGRELGRHGLEEFLQPQSLQL